MTEDDNRFLLDKVAFDFEDLRCTCREFGVQITGEDWSR